MYLYFACKYVNMYYSQKQHSHGAVIGCVPLDVFLDVVTGSSVRGDVPSRCMSTSGRIPNCFWRPHAVRAFFFFFFVCVEKLPGAKSRGCKPTKTKPQINQQFKTLSVCLIGVLVV